MYGSRGICDINMVLYNITDRDNSLSRSIKTGMQAAVRINYKYNYKKWHNSDNKLFIEFPLKKRKFYASKEIL